MNLRHEKVKYEMYFKRGVFRTLSSIYDYDRPFCKNSQQLKAINYFRKKPSIADV